MIGSAKVIRRARCRGCGLQIALVKGVGWLHEATAEGCTNPKPRRRFGRR